ncbi:serine hydrolase [Psychroserpens jangbogonensis]|uniref:serine hydrolase n=1 Tax=Psychroserpens jangbogonensis TaxID=1484460 RepID=UPI00053F0E4C|nr:serine hydrolase [Psychroserpens jangbogonensis]
MRKSIAVIIVLILGFNSFSQTGSNKKLEKNINEVFESYTHYNRFIGNVLISQNDNIIYRKSFGDADAENHKKNTGNSIFRIASVTKPLTAVGIMKLVDQGELTLETPISTYFPSFIPDFSKKITIRHLLNHSSGMQANVGRIDDQGNGVMPGENPITLNELFEKFKNSKLKFEPGTAYEYNNFGYTLLAYIIENVTKQSYADYMEQAVFKPANMKNTAVNAYKALNQRAFPHTGLGMNEFKRLSNSIHSSWITGGGDINSTTNDLYNFMEALENGTLLKPASVDKLYSYTQSRGVNNSEYGLGWRIENKGGEKWINHTGLLPGFTSIIGSLPQKNIKIIILSNATSTDLITESTFQGKGQFVDGEIIDKVIAVLQGKNPELLPVAIKINNQNTADFRRTYMIDTNHSLILSKQGDDYSLETIGTESWSVFTYKFSRDAKEDNKPSETALFFANAMSTQKFEGLIDYSSDDMKGFFASEEGKQQLKGMWAYFIKQAGEFKSYNIYKVEGEAVKTVNIRFHFEKEDVGFVIAINSVNQIQGMFMDDDIRTSAIQKVKLTPINENEFFINGHQNDGMQDLKIKISEKGLILIDDNKKFKAVFKSSF